MQKSAPFADMPIALSVRSTTGLRYRVWNCMECGREFLERSGDTFYRVGSTAHPEEVSIGSDGRVTGICSGCQQRYTVTIAFTVSTTPNSIPLYMQPESIFIVNSQSKKLRDVFCLECGKAFYSVSDRISQIVDNVAPVETWDPNKMGPMEARCKFHNCKQRWYVRV